MSFNIDKLKIYNKLGAEEFVMSINEFDEYEYKNNNERIRIKYDRDYDQRLNPWEITNFIDRVSTYMYKIEMLNTIALAINQGVDKKNIFVLDKAYKLNGKYKNFSSINLNTLAINSLYSIGKPISMMPNQNVAELRYLFEILYNVNKILYRFHKKRITKVDRLHTYSIMRKEGFLKALQAIIEISNEKVDREEQIKASKIINRECSKVMDKYQKYLLDAKKCVEVELKLEKNNREGLLEGEQDLEKEYYKKFYEYLFKLPRPVVGIYYEEENKIKILCADHFDSSINKNSKIDLKSVTQNSPIMAEIEAGCEILALRKDEKRKQEIHELKKRKLELEISKLEKENDLIAQEKIANDLDILNKTIEAKIRLDSLAENEENLGLKKIASSYTSQQLFLLNNKVQNGYSEILKTNKFIETQDKVIDIKV